MTSWHLLRHLDWARFLSLFIFVDVSTVVIGVWALVSRAAGAPQDSPALENLRQMSMDAQHELQALLADAIERSEQNARSGQP